MNQPTTTFARLHQHGACESGYRRLAKTLGGVPKYGRDKPIPLDVVLASNGLEDTLWCLRALLEPWEQEQLFIADLAEHVLPIFEEQFPNDARPRRAIEAMRAFARGEIDATTLKAARYNARVAESCATGYGSCEYAAQAATYDVAWCVSFGAQDAVGEDGGKAEQEWQHERLVQYLTGMIHPKAKAA